MRLPHHTQRIGFCLIILSLLIASCRAQNTPAPAFTQPAPSQVVATPTLVAPTPTAAPRSLVVCLGQEPETLYPYGRGSASMWSVLEAIYDGPIDQLGASGNKPVILEALPSLDNQGATIQNVAVQPGDEIVNSDGNLSVLAQGIKVRPAGCTSPDCAIAYDGKSPLEMPQMSVRFKLLPGLTWSDGAPLKASDSVYSFRLASDQETPVSKFLVDRTVSYTAKDDLNIEWVGKPGFVDAGYQTFFWMPLPEHLWSSLSPTDLLTADASARKPVGWGPYVIDEWVQGDHIRLHKNANYFRAKEGLPRFDELVFRFIGENSSANANALQVGECDVLAQSTRMEEQLSLLSDLEKAGKVQPYYAAGPEWEHMDFGIRPASYDDGYNPAAGDRPDLFGDVRVRQAFAYCSDRQAINNRLLLGKSYAPASYLPQDHPLYNADVVQYAFNPQEGNRLLDAAGWKDTDADPATPRIAQGVARVPAGTALSVTYLTSQADLRVKAAQILQESMAQCGIQVKIQSLDPATLFAPGPDGPLFGRKFDLAQFSWQASSSPACFLYESRRIPNAANHWVGENVTGYSNPDFDKACQAGLQLQPDLASMQEEQAKAQDIFAKDLPVLPLYMDLSVDVTRPNFCGFNFIPGTRSDLWGIEAYNYGPECKAP